MGFGEIFLVLFIVLLFFGSKSIPTIARTLGKAMREVKTATCEIQREIRDTAGDLPSDVQKMRELNIKRHMEEAMMDDPTPQKPSLAKPAEPISNEGTIEKNMSDDAEPSKPSLAKPASPVGNEGVVEKAPSKAKPSTQDEAEA